MVELPVVTSDVPVAFVKESCETVNGSVSVRLPMVAFVELSSCIVELPVVTSDVPVAFVKDNCPIVPVVMTPCVTFSVVMAPSVARRN